MSTFYYDLAAAVNGNGASATPFNLTGWTATTVSAGNSYLFKRGNRLSSAFTTVAGTNATTLTSYGAWYNADGSDDPTKPRPLILTSTALSTYSSTNKDYVSLDSLNIRGLSLPIADDANLVFMGTGASITNCIVRSNVGGVGSYAKSNVTIDGNTIYGVAHGASNTNYALIVSDTSADNVQVKNNKVYHLGGGSSNSHAMRIECSDTAGALTNLVVFNNTVSPVPRSILPMLNSGYFNASREFTQIIPSRGIYTGKRLVDPAATPFLCPNKSALGLRLARCPGAFVVGNRITGFQDGIFFVGGGASTAITLTHNYCSYNRHFGLHATTDAIGCTIEWNTCSFNGTRINDGVLSAYGRGIELSSAAGQGRCANHTIAFNTCDNNYNWGGPNDNASEGVGIGLDDGVSGCNVYGNILRNNEGSGIQGYGGSGTDTYNHIVGNYFKSNCTASFNLRRTGGTNKTAFCAHINLANTLGSNSSVANNLFDTGTTLAGVWIASGCLNITLANNIFVDTLHAIALPSTVPASIRAIRNDFYSNMAVVQPYATLTVNGSGTPTFPDHSYTGTNDYTFNPGLSTAFVPSAGSSAINAGFTVGSFHDFNNHLFDTPPTLGMIEVHPSALTYYVSTTGNDANAGTTPATAFLSISKGAQVAVAGDTVNVLSGNYQGSIYINDYAYASGTTAAPITLKSITPLAAKIRALAVPAAGSGLFAAFEVRASNWVIDGFELTGEDGYTNTADTSWNYSTSTEWCYGFMMTGLANIVKNCYIHDLARGSVAASRGGAALASFPNYGGGASQFLYNRVERLGSANTGNNVHGIRADDTATYALGNLVVNVNGGACIKTYAAASNLIAANNTLATGAQGIAWGQDGELAVPPFFKNARAFNNIILDCSIGILESGNIGSGNLIDTNMTWNCTTPYSLLTSTAVNKISLSPTFVNYVSTGGGDYHLLTASGAINVGVASLSGYAAPVLDIDGVTRPVSATYDLGAYEFASISAVVSPTLLRRIDRWRIFHKH